MTFPYVRPLNIHPPTGGGGGGDPTGRCVYCDSNCDALCVDGKTEAECAALHDQCTNGDKQAYVWTQGASCNDPNPPTVSCGTFGGN